MGASVSINFLQLTRERKLTPVHLCRTQKQHYLELETVSFVSADGSARKDLHKMSLDITFDALASSHSNTPSPSHQQISLLSLELTSFSSSSIAACTPQDQLPLKAVYKETVVGIRYLHIPPEERFKGRYAQTEWKRVQVKFLSVEGRKRFIEAIKGVCPVKLADGATEEGQQVPSPKKSRTAREAETAKAGAHHSGDGASPQQAISSTSAFHTPPTITSSTEQPLPTPAPAPFAAPRSTTSSTASQLLPPALAALLPKLASTLKSDPTTLQDRTSLEMAEIDSKAFGALFTEVIAEEGFEKLVERVKGHLQG
jgi:hypothetical protein